MTYKYGVYPSNQFQSFKKRLHSWVHWFLIYVEQNEPHENVNKYFTKIQYEINGLNELLNHPAQVVEIMTLLESAKIEYNKPDFDYRVYRKIIFDVHELIDRISDGD